MGYPPPYEERFAPAPPTYLWQAIVATLLCCLPFGVVAIVQATRVGSRFSRGDVAGAAYASAQAKKWVIAAVVTGLVVEVLYFLAVTPWSVSRPT